MRDGEREEERGKSEEIKEKTEREKKGQRKKNFKGHRFHDKLEPSAVTL